MTRFTCLSGDAAPGRRAVLGGAAATLALAATGHAAQQAALAELVDADGRWQPRAHALAETRVRLVGYLAPSFEPGNDDWRLSEAPAMPCQLCGAGHDDGAGLALSLTDAADLSPLQAVAVTGFLDLSTAVPRLRDARMEAL